tara:strand:- start:2609 stop:3601 length:993 start_codon:yes stop_codon:yes gene_type:complete
MHKSILLIIILIFFSGQAYSYEDPKKYPDIDSKFISLEINDPEQKVGYTVGDIIKREIIFTVKKPYKLIEESLPIVGYEKKYRGQALGISLTKINIEKEIEETKSKFRIKLEYQIFTNNVVAKPAFITADYYRLIDPKNPKKVVKYRIPELVIAVSPISIFGQIKIENDMSPLRGPFKIDANYHIKNLRFSIIGLIFCIILLLYIYSQFSLMPGQNKFFSHIYKINRKNKYLQKNNERFITDIHNSFNKTIGQTLFKNNTNILYKKNKKFKHIEKELDIFFNLSRNVFFEQNKKLNHEEVHNWLVLFCKHCRMCERKLIVDSKDISTLNF